MVSVERRNHVYCTLLACRDSHSCCCRSRGIDGSRSRREPPQTRAGAAPIWVDRSLPIALGLLGLADVSLYATIFSSVVVDIGDVLP